ncbi:MAG: hypothetical protein R3Y28_04050 [Candidatus Gastranaerophilales bacterium]
MNNEAKELIKYFKTLGLEIHTTTQARGHQGFFLKNRIDISKNIAPERIVPTLLHEFAHYIHFKIEPDMNKSCGTLEALFRINNEIIFKELLQVTNFVDNNSACIKLYEHKERVKNQIKELEKIIKNDYPKFLRSKKFKEFDKFIKKSNARFLLKYDRVKVVNGFFKKSYEVYTIANLENDFTEMPKSFIAYIRLKSCQRKQKRISSRINKYKKYYEKPTELFARFVEGLYTDKEWIEAIAPNTFRIFHQLLEEGHYHELKNALHYTRPYISS